MNKEVDNISSDLEKTGITVPGAPKPFTSKFSK
jgi:hypothetical protein